MNIKLDTWPVKSDTHMSGKVANVWVIYLFFSGIMDRHL